MIPLLKKQRKPAGNQAPLSIAVADDVEAIRELVRVWLESMGHSVVTASSGRELLRLVKERMFDLVITDIVMPDGDGWEAILAINRIRPDIRILAISGGGAKMPPDACLRMARGVGADVVLKKPFNRPEFIEAFARATGR